MTEPTEDEPGTIDHPQRPAIPAARTCLGGLLPEAAVGPDAAGAPVFIDPTPQFEDSGDEVALVPDGASPSDSVWRLHWNPDTRKFEGAEEIHMTADPNEDRPRPVAVSARLRRQRLRRLPALGHDPAHRGPGRRLAERRARRLDVRRPRRLRGRRRPRPARPARPADDRRRRGHRPDRRPAARRRRTRPLRATRCRAPTSAPASARRSARSPTGHGRRRRGHRHAVRRHRRHADRRRAARPRPALRRARRRPTPRPTPDRLRP